MFVLWAWVRVGTRRRTFPHSPLHLLRRHIFDAGGDPPDVPRRVLDGRGPIAVKLGSRHLLRGSPRFQASLVRMIDVLNVDVQLAGYGTVLTGRIGHHNDGTANLDLGMTHVTLSVIDQRSLFRVESVLKEIDESWYSVHDQVWCNRRILLRNRSNLAGDRLHAFPTRYSST